MPGHMDQERARAAMRADGLDALLLCTPENVYYASGYWSFLFGLYRQAPMGVALVALDPAVEPALILPERDVLPALRDSGWNDVRGHPVWTETTPLPAGPGTIGQRLQTLLAQDPVELPEQFDVDGICRLVAKMLQERGLAGGRLGLELGFVDVNTFSALQRALPDARFVDSGALVYDLRAIKNSAEIALHRHACGLAEAGISAAAKAIRLWVDVPAVTRAFESGVWDEAAKRGVAGALGPILGAPEMNGPGAPAGHSGAYRGSTWKFDVQTSVGHYHADIGRSFVLGEALPEHRRVSEAEAAALRAAYDTLRPGTPICDVYRAAEHALRARGLPRYSRGHFGHSIGLDPKTEEPPFISATETRPLVPGMVLSIEAPFYCPGFGVFMFEDMHLITESGHENLNRLPLELGALPV